MTSGFQTQVYNQPAQAFAGDRASQNAIATLDAGPGGLIADASGIFTGRFAWTTTPTDPNGANGYASQVLGIGNVAGFAYNVTQGLNPTFLSDGTMLIPQGLPVSLAIQGDFWVINSGAAIATVGQKAYAQFGTGLVTFAAAGAPTTGATATGSSVAASTFSVTGSIQNDIMTVTAVGSGTVVNGGSISGTGIVGSPQVISQLNGTTGGVGQYLISPSQQKSVASTTISGTYGTFTVGTMTVGTAFFLGGTISGGSAAGQLTQLLTGTGGNGSTFVTNNNTAQASTSISETSNIETKWYAASVAQPGGLIKISSWVGAQG